jgi:hypothetical protein
MFLCAGLVYAGTACAAGADVQAEKFTKLMSSPGGMLLVAVVGILIVASSIRLAALVTGAGGSFGHCALASIVTLVITYCGQLVLGPTPPRGLGLALSVLAGVAAIRLCMEVSWGQALMTTVLSWVAGIILVIGVAVLCVGLALV